MRTMATKLTIGTALAAATSAVLAAPAFADDGATVVAAPPAIADVLRTTGTGAAVVAGVVLLSKGIAAYRRSQWRRQWILRCSTEALYVSSVGWPGGGLSGRSVARPAAGIVGGSVARSATSL